jgi:hypothetical protein
MRIMTIKIIRPGWAVGSFGEVFALALGHSERTVLSAHTPSCSFALIDSGARYQTSISALMGVGASLPRAGHFTYPFHSGMGKKYTYID